MHFIFILTNLRHPDNAFHLAHPKTVNYVFSVIYLIQVRNRIETIIVMCQRSLRYYGGKKTLIFAYRGCNYIVLLTELRVTWTPMVAYL